VKRLLVKKDLPESDLNFFPEVNTSRSIGAPSLITWLNELAPAITEGIILIDASQCIYYFSSGAERISGWNRNELCGKSIFEIFNFFEYGHLLTANQPGAINDNRAEIQHREGYPVSIKYWFSQPPGQRQEAASSIIIFQDSREADAAIKLRAFFLANITHEFRTPLSSLNASVEFLLEEIKYLSRNEIEALLTSVHLSVTGLQTLIDNLLESIQIEAGRFTISPRTSDLDKIISEARRIMSPLFTRRQQVLNIQKPEGSLQVHCDPTRITQVLVNLLSNASKYGPTQQEILMNVIPADDNWLKVAVTDHGPGILAERSVIQQYYRLGAKSSAQDGVGLGLWVVRVIIEQHGGSVGVEEAPEGGSKFWFTIPSAR
jgi:signal transduction histidine kinase